MTIRFLTFILLFIPFMAFAGIPSTAYVQEQIANQIVTALANKADKSAVESLSEKIGNIPDYLGGWQTIFGSSLKEPASWAEAFIGKDKGWDIPSNFGEVFKMLLGEKTTFDGLLSTVFSAIYTELSSLATKITTAQTTAETANSKADTNTTAISTRVDTSASANQTMAGTYTVSGTLNLTGVATIETPPLPTAE